MGLRHGRRHVPALLLFIVLTGALAFPIAASMRTAIPGWEGDNLYYVRSMWWMKHAILDLRTSPFFDPTSYYPIGQLTGRSEMTSANTVPAIPLTLAFGPVVAYNLVLLVSFVATGFFTYLWVERLTGQRAAGVLAGTIAAFLPLRFAHLVGHLPQVTTQWIPFSLYAFELYFEKHTLRRALLLGLGVALSVLGCWYYGYSLLLMLPVYAVLRTLGDRAVWKRVAWWRGISAAALLAFALVLPLLVPMLQLRDAGQLRRSLAEMDSWSLNPYDFFVPNLAHPVWGETLAAAFPRQRALWVERGVSLGTVAVLMAVVGVAVGRPRRSVTALLAVWLASYLVALGPTLHYHDEQVRVPVPSRVAAIAGRILASIDGGTGSLPQGLVTPHHVPVPLPSFVLYLWVPLTASMRVMARFGLWTGLMTAGLAGFGLARLVTVCSTRYGRAVRRIVPTLLVSVVAFESLSVIPMLLVVPRPVDEWLARQHGQPVVVELPVEQALRSYQNYWATVRGCPDLFGWRGDSFPSPLEVERRQALESFPSPQSVTFLKSSGATHVILSSSLASAPDVTRSPWVAEALRLERDFGAEQVYRVVR